MKTLGVVIARFQAHHITPAHEYLLWEALRQNDRVLVLLGVHPVVRKKDPLDFADRFQMVWSWWEKNKSAAAASREQGVNFLVLPAMNHPDDAAWVQGVDQSITAMAFGGKVTIYCGPDGASVTYIRNGGRYECSVIDSFEKHATSVRAALLPRDSEDYRVGKIVASEQRFVNPYMCVDAVVTDGEHVLVGRKETDPAGLWRLVGGFVDSHESLEEACRREVREETGLVVQHLTYVTSGPVTDWRYAGGPENILSACYVAVVKKGHAQPGDDIAELTWCTIEGFNVARIHPSHAQFVRASLGMLEKAIHDAELAL